MAFVAPKTSQSHAAVSIELLEKKLAPCLRPDLGPTEVFLRRPASSALAFLSLRIKRDFFSESIEKSEDRGNAGRFNGTAPASLLVVAGASPGMVRVTGSVLYPSPPSRVRGNSISIFAWN